MKKLKFFLNFDHEEAWLNRLAQAGSLISAPGPVYRFSPIEPGTAVVRVDYRPAMSEADFTDYRTLFADAGWLHQAGTRRGGAQYFASFAGEPNADIFSDAGSRAERYRRSIAASSLLLLPFLVLVFILWTQGNLFPAQGYLTPGLWQKQGLDLVGALLFETPFVLLRFAGPCILLAFCVALVIAIGAQSQLLRKASR